MPGTDQRDNNQQFVSIIGEIADTQYLHNRLTIIAATDAQEQVLRHRWPSADIAEHALRHVVRSLELHAQRDKLIGQVATISGPTLDLPEAQIDPSRRGAMITPHIIGSDEFVEQTFVGARGQFAGFHYILTENDDNTVGARLVYQVKVASVDTANMHASMFATADVSHDTDLEFAYDHQFRELADAMSVFESVGNDEILICAQELHALLMNGGQADYSVESLHRIAYIVMALSTHESLQDIRQPAAEAIETMVTSLMPARMATRPRVVSHTGGLYQYYTDAKKTKLSSLQPYIQESDEQPITLNPAHITEVTVLPGDRDPIVEGVELAETPIEPHLIVRHGLEIRYIPLSKITDIM